MKSKYVSILICMSFVAVLFLSGLVSNVQGEEENSSVNQSYSEREAYKENAKAKLAEQDRKIEELEVKARDGNAEERAEARRGLRELRNKRATLKSDIASLETAGKDTWEAAKREVNMAIDDLERTYERVRDYFR
jgi:peptidoglycan hydrolase CwlO-like protein